MKIKFKQWGGIAGGPVPDGDPWLDTAEMPASEARILEGLVAASNILSLKGTKSSWAQDAGRYEFEIIDGGVSHRVNFDVSVPDSVKPLLDFLRERAKSR